jgi:predicted ATP-dependent endonuclease of OLD family
MKIAVQNLGTIKEGSISLDKSLTVLVGPNNSGKSYISYLIYGFLKDEDKFKDFSFDIKDDELKEDEEWLALGMKDILFNNIDRIAEHLNTHFNENIIKYFSSNKINAKLTLPFIKKVIENDIYSRMNWEGVVSSDDDLKWNGQVLKISRKKVKNFDVQLSVNNQILKNLWSFLAKDKLYPEIHFFPTERLALSMLSNDEVERKSKQQDELSKLLLDNKADDEFIKNFLKEKKRFKPSYPQAINDYIYFINDLRDIVKQEGDYADFADEIQEMLMQGKIAVSSYGDINYIPEGQEEPIEIHISSSLVKSLSGLILYFRHVAQEGDTIIIDEPEVNLHPNNQRIIARVMAKAVNKGFKVILSTHSDYIIKELNNLVMLNKANEKPEIKKALLADLAKDGYDEDSYLKKEDLGVYFFNNHTIQELEVDDMGFDVATIDTELDKMTYSSEQIYYSLFGQQEAE